MTTQQEKIAEQRKDAEIYEGEEICKQRSHLLLDEIHLPKELLPLENIIEMGHNRATGFVWLKTRHKKVHCFKAIDRTVSFETEITAFVEEHRMRRITGVKTKEFFVWITISDIFVNDPSSGKIMFANSSGIARSFPLTAFHDLQDEHTP